MPAFPWKLCIWGWQHPCNPQGKGCKLCPGGIQGFIVSFVVENSKGLIWSKIENYLPSHIHPFPKHFQSKFEYSHFLQHSWKVWKLCLWGLDPPPRALREKVLSYALGAHGFYRKHCCKNFKKVHLIEIEKASVLINSQNWSEGKAPPPHSSFPITHPKRFKYSHFVQCRVHYAWSL